MLMHMDVSPPPPHTHIFARMLFTPNPPFPSENYLINTAFISMNLNFSTYWYLCKGQILEQPTTTMYKCLETFALVLFNM